MDWFVAVADGDREKHAVRTFLGQAEQRIDHPSGRPWLLGCWDRLVYAAIGHLQVAVLGATSVTADQLAAWSRRDDLDAVARRLTGDWHLVAAVDGQLIARGMISGQRRVCHARIDGVPVVADRADLLARDGVDERVLAVNLLTRGAGQLGDVSPWRGVRRVPADSYLLTTPDGTAREVRWWRPPDAELSLADGVPLVRQALDDAVAARLAGARTVSADLSGGMDSTSVCFLIDRIHWKRFITRVIDVPDSDFDDIAWAARAAECLDVEHGVLQVEDVPEMFGGLEGEDAVWADPEQPHGWVRSRKRFVDLATRMAAADSTVHFTGACGDELFRPWTHYLHAFVRTHPLRAVRELGAYRRYARWPIGQLVRALADRRSYRETVRSAIARITEPEQLTGVLDLSWAGGLHLPPWATPLAAELARDQLTEMAEHAEPLGRDRAAHSMLESVRGCAENARLADRLMRRHGVRAANPFLDDRVVEAALSVRQSEHAGPVRYKPLLASAMRGIVPDDILARRTKGEFSSEVHFGLRRNRAALVRMFEDSELARLGLIDPAGVHDVLVGIHRDNLGVIALESTLACEVWLRGVATGTACDGRGAEATASTRYQPRHA